MDSSMTWQGRAITMSPLRVTSLPYNDKIYLTSIDFQCPIIDFYEDVDFQPIENAADV